MKTQKIVTRYPIPKLQIAFALNSKVVELVKRRRRVLTCTNVEKEGKALSFFGPDSSSGLSESLSDPSRSLLAAISFSLWERRRRAIFSRGGQGLRQWRTNCRENRGGLRVLFIINSKKDAVCLIIIAIMGRSKEGSQEGQRKRVGLDFGEFESHVEVGPPR